MGNTAADDSEDDAYTISDQLRAILPEDWDAGEDGMGAISSHEARNSMYRKPWQFSNDRIRAMTRLTKVEFFRFVESSIGSRTRENRDLNLWSECLMFLMKISQDTPYQMLGTHFEVDAQLAQTVVYRQVLHQYFNHTNIPCIINADGSVNQAELSKMFRSAHANTPEFFKQLTFEDPLNLGRIGVYLNIDATYLFTQNSMDVEMQKSLFCQFKAGHLFKWLTITDLRGKVQGQCPASTSNTPASGDKSILARYIDLEEGSALGQYIRAIMKGTAQFFPIWVVDAGFVARVPNAPRETRDLDGLTELSDQEGCIVIHPSNMEHTYHLGENDRGELKKVDRDPDRPTLDEVAVMFTRKLRKFQEMSFGVQKRMFKLIGHHGIANSLAEPLSSTFMKKFNVPADYADVPKITFFMTTICSIYNKFHAGFKMLFYSTPEQEIEAADRLKKRMKAENPILHNVFNINFDTRVRGPWTAHTFQDFSGPSNVLNLPKITEDEINPTAVQATGGPHSIVRGHSVLTYISQIHVKENNIIGDEAKNIIQTFPNFHKVESLRVTDRPDNWDDSLFGPWQNITFVRSVMPPTHKSISSPQNFHTCVIAFGDQGSDRLGLFPPLDRILFYYCHRCPSLNALCNMDRHLAALLEGICFPEHFKSTAKNIRILNPVALPSNQCLISLPRGIQSKEIPQNQPRRSRDTRQAETNPLYCYGPLPQPRSVSVGPPISRVRRPSSRGRSTARGQPVRGSSTTRGTSGTTRGANRGRGRPSSVPASHTPPVTGSAGAPTQTPPVSGTSGAPPQASTVSGSTGAQSQTPPVSGTSGAPTQGPSSTLITGNINDKDSL